MNMLIIENVGKLDGFVKRYILDAMGEREYGQVHKALTITEACQLLSVNEYAFVVLDLEFILQVCSLSVLADLFERISSMHIIAVGTSMQYSALDIRIREQIRTFYNLDVKSGHTQQLLWINDKENRDENETDRFYRTFLYRLSRGKKYSLIEMDNLEKHMRLNEQPYFIFAISVDFYGSDNGVLNRAAIDLLESILPPDNDIKLKACYVPSNVTSFLGLISYRYVRKHTLSSQFVYQYCKYLRYELQRIFGRQMVLTLGISSRSSNHRDISRLFEEAENVGFSRVYDGTGKDYFYEDMESKRTKKTFSKKEHIMELKHAIEVRSAQEIRQTMEHLFSDVKKCRLEKLKLQGLLMEIMAMMFGLCVEEEIDIGRNSSDGSDSMDFLFIQNIESVDVECSSFAGYFEMILKEAAEKKEFITAYSSKIRKAIGYIYNHYNENIRLKDIADSLEISPNYLCSIFKKETGIKVVEYIHAVRIEKAKDFIVNTNYTASQIAECTGFSDTAYFCTVFKKRTGYTVTDYRSKFSSE